MLFRSLNFLFSKNVAKYLLQERTNLTVEFNLSNYNHAVDLIPLLRKSLTSSTDLHKLKENYQSIFKDQLRPSMRLLKLAEQDGRVKIVERHLINIFKVAPKSLRKLLLEKIFPQEILGLSRQFLEYSHSIVDARLTDYACNFSALLNFIGSRIVNSNFPLGQLTDLNLFLRLLVRESLMGEIIKIQKSCKALIYSLPEKFGKTPKRVLLTLAIDGSEHLLELRNTEVDKIKRLKIKVFSYGVNESESEVKNEKEKYQKNFIGRSRFIRRRPLKIGKLAQKAISGGHI